MTRRGALALDVAINLPSAADCSWSERVDRCAWVAENLLATSRVFASTDAMQRLGEAPSPCVFIVESLSQERVALLMSARRVIVGGAVESGLLATAISRLGVQVTPEASCISEVLSLGMDVVIRREEEHQLRLSTHLTAIPMVDLTIDLSPCSEPNGISSAAVEWQQRG
jgi:hypothetical protein